MEGPLSSEDQSFGLSEPVDFVCFLRLSLLRVQVKSLIEFVHARSGPVQQSL